jgi:hypothetical protein
MALFETGHAAPGIGFQVFSELGKQNFLSGSDHFQGRLFSQWRVQRA